MKIIYDFPPNYDEVANTFPVRSDTVFTYGDTLYSPRKQILPLDLIIHEEVHVRQQTDPVVWWRKYIDDREFRLSQEIEAYRSQYRFYCKNVLDRNKRAVFLHRIASDLSSSMYGRIISYADASKQIR